MKAVVDTNVLLSGLMNAHGHPGRIVDWIRSGRLRLVVDDRIVEEYIDVLSRERMQAWISKEDAGIMASFLQIESERIASDVMIDGLPDPADAPFIEVAITANVPLVTGDLKHFPKRLCREHEVVGPTAFCERYA